jgi:hypothetical protein
MLPEVAGAADGFVDVKLWIEAARHLVDVEQRLAQHGQLDRRPHVVVVDQLR